MEQTKINLEQIKGLGEFDSLKKVLEGILLRIEELKNGNPKK